MPSSDPSPRPSASAYVTLDGVAARTPDGRTLFDNLSLAFGRERTGVVGRNGAGKTTLLRLVAGLAQPAEGAVTRAGSIGWLPHTAPLAASETAAESLGVGAPLAVLQRVLAGQGDEGDLAAADWTLDERLRAALSDAGLPGLDLARPTATLSGGEQTRLRLAGLLLARPDLLVLDEPTNHLDADARGLVADLLGRWPGGAVVVSHDRALLRRMDRIVELTSLGAAVHGGNYDLYAERKAVERAAAERALCDAERRRDEAERAGQREREKKARRDGAGRRYGKSGSIPRISAGLLADRAEDSGGRGRALAERRRQAAETALSEARDRVERVRQLAVPLPSTALPAGRVVLELEAATWVPPHGAPLLPSQSLRVVGPERLAVTGPNGAGKSTLLRLISGGLEPTAGRVRRGVQATHLDQAVAILDPGETLLEAYRRLNPEASSNDAHAALARFLFRNQAARREVGSLSGGERLRAALACLMTGARPPQLLVLDEPTNHLDLESIEAVEAALAAYDGALVVVSHDEDFLAAIRIERRIELGA